MKLRNEDRRTVGENYSRIGEQEDRRTGGQEEIR